MIDNIIKILLWIGMIIGSIGIMTIVVSLGIVFLYCISYVFIWIY